MQDNAETLTADADMGELTTRIADANRQAQEALGSRTPWPSLGRIVMYTNLGDSEGRYPPEDHPAIVTGVQETNEPGTPGPFVSLHIFYKTGQFDMDSVPYSPEQKRGHWRWPDRIS